MQTVSDLITQVRPALYCNQQSAAQCTKHSACHQLEACTLLLLAAKPVLQIRQGFSLLEHIAGLHLELDGYTILEGQSLDLFRDGDVVTVKASQALLAFHC